MFEEGVLAFNISVRRVAYKIISWKSFYFCVFMGNLAQLSPDQLWALDTTYLLILIGIF